MPKNKEIEEILSTPSTKAVCTVCGSVQTHKKIYCSSCGTKYGKPVKNLFEGMKVCHNRVLQDNITDSHALSPGYIAAIYRRTLKAKKISPKVFEEYVTKRLKGEKV